MVRISNLQLSIMIFSSILANGMLSLPRIAAGLGGPGGWINVLLQGMVSLVALVALATVCKQFPEASFVNLNKKVFGNLLGTLLGAIIIIYFVLLAGDVARGVTNVAITGVYDSTPMVVLIAILIAVAVYAIYQGIEVLARVNAILFLLKVGALIGIFLLSIPELNLDYLLPLWERGPLTWSEGIVNIHAAYSGFLIVAFLYPNLNKNKETIKIASLGLVMVIVAYVMVTVTTIATFNCREVSRMIWPTLYLIRNIPVQVDAPFMAAWVTSAFSVVAACLYIASDALKDILKLKDYRSIVMPLAIIVAVIGTLPKDLAEFGEFSTNITYIGFMLEILLPFTLLAIIALTKKKSKE